MMVGRAGVSTPRYAGRAPPARLLLLGARAGDLLGPGRVFVIGRLTSSRVIKSPFWSSPTLGHDVLQTIAGHDPHRAATALSSANTAAEVWQIA
jgi:hypothetical protein